MTPAATLLLALTKGALSHRPLEGHESLMGFSAFEWNRFYQLVRYHDFAPFAYRSLRPFGGQVPHETVRKLATAHHVNTIRCGDLWREYLRIHSALQSTGIAHVPIKGMALLHDVYGASPSRPMVDIDLLVQREHRERAAAMLCSLGYHEETYGLHPAYRRQHDYQLTFRGRFATPGLLHAPVKLYWMLDYPRRHPPVLPALWKRIRTLRVAESDTNLLSPEDTLFSLALHNRRFGKVLSLKIVYDFSLVVDKYHGAMDWDYLLREAVSGRMQRTLYFMLTQAALFFDARIPRNVLSSLKVPTHAQRLIRRLIVRETLSIPLRHASRANKKIFLLTHFLLYDSWREPIDYILRIPQEQFATYYNLEPYTKRTRLRYNGRLIYMPLRTLAQWNSSNEMPADSV